MNAVERTAFVILLKIARASGELDEDEKPIIDTAIRSITEESEIERALRLR